MSVVAEDRLESINPATLEVVGSVRATEPIEVQELVSEARLAQERWAQTSFGERRRLFEQLVRVLLVSMDEIAETVTAEVGKPLAESYGHEVLVSVEHSRWLAANTARFLRPERLPRPALYLPQKRQRVEHEPLGVVAIIAPWNVPFGIMCTQAATVVAAGNAAVVKPSELTPLSGQLLEEIFARAGFPAGLVRVAQGAGDVGAALVQARGVGKVLFSGSVGVGRLVAIAAAERLVPVTLELGREDPMLVLKDADLERAVEGALWGAFANCGQICMSVERIYVERDLYEPFVHRLAERARELRIGRGDALDTDVGPLTSERQREKVERLVADAVDRGADVCVGGRRPQIDLPGWFYEPTVLTGTKLDDELAREEIFGPVVTVDSVAGDEELVAAANGTPFGLGASVWTRDADRFAALSQRIEAGSVWMNDALYSYASAAAPWGGRKDSGYGVTHGKYALYDATRPKLVDADGGRLRDPWWYPYADHATEGLKGLAEALYGDGLVPRARAAWRYRRGLAGLTRRYFA